MNIIIYGDSNTWGYIPSENFYSGDDSKTARYEKSDMWWSEIEKNNKCFINGNNGRTCAFDHAVLKGKNASKTLNDDLKYIDCNIDLLIIMLGTNDLKKEFNASEEEIATNLFDLIKRIKDKFNCKVLVICPPYIVSGTKKTTLCFINPEQRIDIYHEILMNKCKNNGYYFTDFRGCDIGVDGEHLTLEGHKKARIIINETLKKISNV